QVPTIRRQGGEILKFMGDGLLAVFPIAKDEGNIGAVCARVLEAAREARANVDAMQYPSGDAVERFRFGVALHIGGILFGNIGGSSRLHLTCIGPSVNSAARLASVARVALVSATSLVKTATTHTPSRCAVIMTLCAWSSVMRNSAFSTVTTNSRGV